MKCSICGKEVLKVNPCPYNKEYGFVCESCCEKCFQTEPFNILGIYMKSKKERS